METEKEVYGQIQKEVLIPILHKISLERGALSALAKRLENQHHMKCAKNRLSELHSGSRRLSFFFTSILIRGGVMSVDQILRGRKIEDLNPTEKEIVLRLTPDRETLELIYEAQREGIDFKQLLKISLKRS